MWDWLVENKEWFLSGLGVFLIGPAAYLVKKHVGGASSSQVQRGGKNSVNIQVGGDAKIGRVSGKDRDGR